MSNPKKTRIMVFGTFDGLHKGHLNFFLQARSLSKNPYLIVSIARDVNVKRIKGRVPVANERLRMRTLRKIKIIDSVVLGGIKNHLPHIIKNRPHIIALGYDQKAYVKELRADVQTGHLNVKIVKLKAFRPKIYKSSKLAKAK